MRRGRGIVIGEMVIGLLMGCNNGIAELEKEKESILSISNLRQGFLDVFATFGGMVSDAFGITKETTKKQVGEELGEVGEAVKTVKDKLEKIKGSESYNLIKDKADSIITNAINTLSKIVEGTNKIKEATASASGPIGGHASDTKSAEPAETESVKNLIAGINMICEAAKEVGTEPKGNGNKEIKDSKEIAKLFKTTSKANNADAINGANRAVSATSGADILVAIKAVQDISKTVISDIQNAKNAFEIAIAQKSSNTITSGIQTNASAIAAGLALRAMAKGGKLSTNATHSTGKAVDAVLIGVVDKTVNEIVSTIRRTVDKCLKNVSDCIKEDSGSVVKSK